MSNDYDNTQYTGTLPTDDSPSVTDTWRHPVNVGHLVMGIAFAGMVLVWALIAGDVVADEDIRWLMPIPWVSAGGAGLIAMAIAARRRS
ncbi:MAG: hypothetical protein ACXWDL_13575 [Nocardioides sp.]